MEKIRSADGTVIAFERTGSGPPLALAYGNSDVHQFWEMAGVRPALAEQCTVYAIERRGRGESGDAAGYELAREAEDVAAVVDAIDEPVTLLGHSGGALYSLEAARRTDNLRHLILYDPPIAVGDHELPPKEVFAEMEALLDDGQNEQVLVSFLSDIADLTPDEIDELRSAPLWEDMVGVTPVLPRELRAIVDYEFDAARFADMTTPTLLLTGSESPPLYKDATEAVRAALPNVRRVVTFEGQGHEAMHTAPDRFVEEVLTFTRESN